MSRLRLTAALVAFVLGCTVGNSKIGTPCDGASDCGEGLICDSHDGKGTCQEPHDHEDTEHATEDTEHATEDTEHGHATEDTEHATEDTEHATEDTEHTAGH